MSTERGQLHPVGILEVGRNDESRVGLTYLASEILANLDRPRSSRPTVADEREPVLPAESLAVPGCRHVPYALVDIDDEGAVPLRSGRGAMG